MKKNNKLMGWVQSFFQDYLVIDRGLSQHTVMAYRDTLKLFFAYESSRQHKSVIKLVLDDLNAESVMHFLSHIEKQRGNSIVTRNLRLASLKTFSSFLTTKDLSRAGEYQRIIALPLKKAPHKIIDYLEVREINAIINSIDPSNKMGERDFVLINLLYNTGARVQEICDLSVSSITFGHLPVVTLMGKENKVRQVPIWPDTATLVKEYLQHNQLEDKPNANLFMNACGQPIGRFGIRYIIKKYTKIAEKQCASLRTKTIGPHSFRHSIAMHLLQAGIDLSIIKSWLGHVNLSTTHTYVEIDMEMKRKVLDAYTPGDSSKSLKGLLDKNNDVLSWLESI